MLLLLGVMIMTPFVVLHGILLENNFWEGLKVAKSLFGN